MDEISIQFDFSSDYNFDIKGKKKISILKST